jgi:CRP-like cAMP-binding protein
MTREQVWKAIGDRLRRDFGRLLEVRDVRRVRRVAGDAWIVVVVLAAPSGDLHVADLSVEDSGDISLDLDGDSVIEAVRRAERASMRPEPSPELAAFAEELAGDDGGDLGPALELLTETDLESRIEAALDRNDEPSLLAARELLPRLLAQHERRGETLLALAQVENRLGQPALASGYLEAAAREFADRFDLDALEKAAMFALELSGRDAFAGSPVQRLLEQSRTRLQPVTSIYESRSFAWLSEHLRPKLEANLTLRTLATGETLVSEGDPSLNVFVVKSGLVGVWLEKPSGGSWLVRCCFPGWLLGEGSVLGGENPTCMATLRAERVCEVWQVSAKVVRELMFEDLAFGQRIAETKQLHRIDSFFSMHETMGQLDVQVRDELLACMQRLETFDEDTLLLPAHQVPTVACLVARGNIALFEDGHSEPRAEIPADSFYGVRDTIHRIASGLTAIARAGTTVAFFDGARLQELCERSPENVVAVLERLG